jgi:hypothetical protein
LIRRGRGTIANVAFPKLACLRPQIGHALNPAAPAAITRLQTWIAAWANQVVDMGLLTQTAEPPDGRQLGSRQIRQAVLALVNTGRFSPGRFRWKRIAPQDAGFHKFRISASAGQNLAA